MIVLDTNVISELWKPQPSTKVQAWLDSQMIETLYLSAVSVGELRFGLAALPEGKRRRGFQKRLECEVIPAFLGRVLPFDLEASRAYFELMAYARAAGKR